jgi:uncharacterized membrane protein
VIVFTLLALAELISDKLPKTPSRTASPGLIARIVLGKLWGAAAHFAGSNQGVGRVRWSERLVKARVHRINGRQWRRKRGGDGWIVLGGFAILTGN